MEAIEGTKYISVKEYAEKWSISQSAVSQSMRTKKNAPLLEGHVIQENGRFLLDEEAVRILDAARSHNVVLVDSKEAKEKDEQEKQTLREEIASLKEQLKAAVDLSKSLGATIQTITEEKALLESKKEEFIKGQLLLEEKSERLEKAKEELKTTGESLKVTTERADVAEQKLRDIKNAGFFARRRLIKELKGK